MMTDTARTSRIEEIEANNLELQRLYSEIEAMAAPPASPPAPFSVWLVFGAGVGLGAAVVAIAWVVG